MFRYVLSDEAESDLTDLYIYSLENWGEAHADAYLGELYAVFTRLSENRLIGRERPELGDAIRSFPCGSYIVFYMPHEEGVAVVRVLHGSRDVDTPF